MCESGTTIFQRVLSHRLGDEISRNKVRLIFGARQTGKTVLLRQLLKEEQSIIFNLQDSRMRRRFESDPSSFSREIEALPPHISQIGVDEVQKVPALLDEVQYLYDKAPERWQFFLTGSSARRLRTGAANLLPGRCHIYVVYPVVRPEEACYSGRLPMQERVKGPHFPTQSLETALVAGALPGIRKESAQSAASTLEAYVEVYLEEEIRREALVRDMGAFSNFIRLAALESGNQVNLSKLSVESGVPASTLKNFYQVLVDTFLGHRIPAYGRPSRKRVLSTPRFLFIDLGVRNAAARLPLTPAILPESGGRLLEQWVGQELVHRAGLAGTGFHISFWRTTTGAEVDWVLETPEEDIPIEVKWTRHPKPKDARHLERFLAVHPDRANRGFVVCRSDRAQQLTPRITAIPWQEL